MTFEQSPDPRPRASLYDAIRFLVVVGTLGILSALGFYLVARAFNAGLSVGVRSFAGILLPIVAGSFFFATSPAVFESLRSLGRSRAFLLSFGGGVLVMLALRFLAQRSQIPVTELLIALCIGVLIFTPGSLPALAFGGDRDDGDRALPYYYGVTAGMLVYVVVLGLPSLA